MHICRGWEVRRPRVTRMHMVQVAVLLIVVLMSWGKRMGTSLMSPLKSTLKHELDINNTQWASLISMVWVVGTVSPFIAGLLLDAMGAPLAGAVATALILAGNGICAVAVSTRRLSVFLAGRAVYSLGGGAVFLVGEVILLKWFKGRQLPVAFGCLATIGGLMSFSGPAVASAALSKNANVAVPFWLATGLSVIGLLCFAVYALIHRSHYALDIELVGSGDECGTASIHSHAEKARVDEAVSISHSDKVPAQRIRRGSTERTVVPDALAGAGSMAVEAPPRAGAISRALAKCARLSAGIAALPETYWYVLLCISIQGTLFIPLHEVVPEMMETEWGYTRAQSSKLFVYLHIIPIVMHMLLGVFINRFGHRLSIFFAGSVLVLLAAVTIAFVRRVPVLVSLIIMNLSSTMVPASIFSLMNLVIDNGEIAGAALGLIRSAEFASVTLMEMLDGLLQDADHNRYDKVLVGLVVFSGLLLLVATASLAVDYVANGGRLNSMDPYAPPGPGADALYRSTDTALAHKKTSTMSSSDSDMHDTAHSSTPTAQQRRIPARRYVYLGAIGLLLAAAWTLFIVSLVRM
ncbi:hypothetical protein LPJ61_001388 [Coemansia biformis]|uniref:Lysosomal dipeptide transporter MFSD1 n=1 Tax=Coemansia biformis TaxID=1286918 RepID=A0A9W7YEF7_9FUNG|nr:hypothetical protein LPJ61_001388 [Coemansia biformis]